MVNTKFERYIPISKVDEDERMVYGFASTPALDSDDEIVSVDAIKNALPDYLQYPTLREMHQPKVAGTVKTTTVDDKGLYIGAYVVSDEAWKYVKAGAYKGFSIGGNIKRKTGNVINELSLVEISLVDVPANKEAKIELWKSEGMNKSAYTVYALSNIMINLKDTISYFQYAGKNTKPLDKALESIKAMISTEALETEAEAQESSDAMYLSAKTVDVKKGVLDSLEKVTFDGNPIAEVLRKAVIINMKEEIKKEEKVETPEATVIPQEEVSKEVETEIVEEKTEVTETPKTEETKTTEEEKEVEEDESEKVANAVMQKAQDLTKGLEEVSKTKVKEDVPMAKAMGAVVTLLEKQNEILVSVVDRLAVLEQAAAPTKSKSVFAVSKTEEVKVEDKVVSSELEKKLARKSELAELLNSLGRSEFAKQGYSDEAVRLDTDIQRLSK